MHHMSASKVACQFLSPTMANAGCCHFGSASLRHNNSYLLVVIDYFTKWAEAVLLRDQTAASISAAIIKICCFFGIPDIFHSEKFRESVTP